MTTTNHDQAQIRALVFSNLSNALEGNQFEPSGYLFGADADEIALDLCAFASDFEQIEDAAILTPHVRSWLERRDATKAELDRWLFGTRAENERPPSTPCVFCRAPRLDGHLTCGRVGCSESKAREQRVIAWAADQAGDAQ